MGKFARKFKNNNDAKACDTLVSPNVTIIGESGNYTVHILDTGIKNEPLIFCPSSDPTKIVLTSAACTIDLSLIDYTKLI